MGAAARRNVAAAFVVLAGGIAPAAHAVGGRYDFDGGTPQEHRTVAAALGASAFDWDVVPGRVVIRIERGADSSATPGRIVLDADLLDAGVFAWGVVQHEYAHQVDFLLLDDADRAALLRELGGDAWCYIDLWEALHHASYGCERFASTLAWAYWPVRANCMQPTRGDDEAAALPPVQFRALVDRVLSHHVRANVWRAR
jgi:hypothetical protein